MYATGRDTPAGYELIVDPVHGEHYLFQPAGQLLAGDIDSCCWALLVQYLAANPVAALRMLGPDVTLAPDDPRQSYKVGTKHLGRTGDPARETGMIIATAACGHLRVRADAGLPGWREKLAAELNRRGVPVMARPSGRLFPHPKRVETSVFVQAIASSDIPCLVVTAVAMKTPFREFFSRYGDAMAAIGPADLGVDIPWSVDVANTDVTCCRPRSVHVRPPMHDHSPTLGTPFAPTISPPRPVTLSPSPVTPTSCPTCCAFSDTWTGVGCVPHRLG